jgi:hypothetical protein
LRSLRAFALYRFAASRRFQRAVGELGVSLKMKKLLLIPILMLFLARSLLADPTWFQPQGWTLGTELPAQPQDVSEHKTPVPDGEILESRVGVKQDDDIFVIVRSHFPNPLAPERIDAAYDGGMASMQRGNPRTILSEEKILIGGHEGRRYVLISKDELRVTHHLTIIIGDEAFTFIHEQQAKQAFSAAAAAFFSKINFKKG